MAPRRIPALLGLALLCACMPFARAQETLDASMFVIPMDPTPAAPLRPLRPLAGDVGALADGGPAAAAAGAAAAAAPDSTAAANTTAAANATAAPAAAAPAAPGAPAVAGGAGLVAMSAPIKRITPSTPRLAASPAGAAMLAAAAAAPAAPAAGAAAGCNGTLRDTEAGPCCNCDSLVTPPTPTAEQDRAANRTASQRPPWSGARPGVSAMAAPVMKFSNKNGISYGGGNILINSTKVHLIWYGTWSAGGKQLVRNVLKSLNGSDLQAVQTTYGDWRGRYIRRTLELGSEMSYVDYPYNKTISDAGMEQLVFKALSAGGGPLPSSTSDVYMVLSGPEVSQGGAGGQFCKDFCGWHTYLKLQNGDKYAYGWAGNPVSKCPTDCRVDFGLDGNGLNGNPGVEALIANMVPQIWKAQTDPWLDAWGVNPTAGTGNSNLESADRCFLNYINVQQAANTARWNIELSNGTTTRKWLLQANWANHNGGFCSLSGSQFQTRYTAATNSLSLERHTVGCPLSAALSQFKLGTAVVGANLTTMGYAYTCPPIPSEKVGSPRRYLTNSTVDGSGNARYLDRHNASCPLGSVMQSWKLSRPTMTSMAIEYWCAPLVGTFVCSAPQTTPMANDGGGGVAFLDRLNVTCFPGRYINWLQLTRPQNTKWRYEFRCCTVL